MTDHASKDQTAGRRRRWPRRLAWGLAGLAGLVMVSLAVVVALLATENGTRWTLQTVAEAVPELEVEAVEGTMLDRLTVRGLRLSDGDGAWLTARSVTVDWRPSALLGGALVVESVTGRDVVVARPPLSAPPTVEEADEEGGGDVDPRLLTRVSLRALDVDRLTLGAALLGLDEDLVLAAEGAVTGQRGEALGGRFALRRLEAPGDGEVRFAYRPGETLRLDGAFHEPQGGALAALLGLPGQPAIRLSLNGEGDVEHWEGALLAEAEDVATIEADLSLSILTDPPDQGRAGLSGTLVPGPQAPPALVALARPDIRFALRLARTADVRRVDALEVSSGGWSVQGSVAQGNDGVLSGLLTAEVAQTAEVPETAVQTLTGLPLGRATLSVRLTGTGQAPRLEAELEARETVVAAVSAQAEARLGDELTFDVRGRLDGIGEDMPQLAPVFGEGLDFVLTGQADRAGERVEIEALTVTAEAGTVEGHGGGSLAPLDLSADVTAHLRDLSILAPLANLPLAGAGQVTASLRMGTDGLAHGPIRVSLRDFALGQPMADRLLAGDVDLGADLSLGDDGVEVSGLSLTTPGASLAGRVALRQWSEIDGTLDLAVPALERLEAGVTGAVSLQARLGGDMAAPRITGTVRLPDGSAQGVRVSALSVAFTATPATLDVTELSGRLSGAALAGSAAVDLGQGLIDGRLVLDLSGGALADQGVTFRGPAALTVVLEPRDGRQDMRASLEGEGLEAGGATVRRLRAEAGLGDLMAAPAGPWRVTLTDGVAGGVAFREATVDGRLEGGSLTASLTVAGAPAHPFQATAEVAVDVAAAPLVVGLRAFEVRGSGHRLALAGESRLTVREDGGLSLSDTRLQVDDASARLALELGPQTVALDVEVRDLPLDILALVQPDLPVEGRVSLRATLAGPPANPAGTITLRAPDLALLEAEVSGLGVEADAEIGDGALQAAVALSGIGETPARVTARLPLAFDRQGLPSVPTDQPVSATVAWQGPIEAVWALVPQVGNRLSGAGSLDARLDGTLDALRFSGQGRLRDGRYENLEYGTVLRALEATASLAEDGSVDLVFSANDGGQGRVSGEGRLTAGADQTEALSGRLDLTEARLIRRDDLTAALGGSLTYDGGLTDGTLRGALRTHGAEIDLGGSLGGGGASALTVTEINREALPEGAGRAAPDADAADEGGAAFGRGVVLDISIDIPGQIFVRGQGLDSEWQGALTVGGTLADPRIVGDLRVVRGSYDLIGKAFLLERGIIDLRGGDRVDPGLDVRATHKAGDLTAIVAVSGTASRPEISLESQPALPRDEVLARTLFGRGMADLGPAQAIAVARAASQLTGGGGGGALDITGRLRSGLGLDVLSFGGGEDGPTVEAGKYVTEGVYVGVEQGAGEASSSVNVEVELTPRVTVRSKTAGAGDSDIGVEWKFDY